MVTCKGKETRILKHGNSEYYCEHLVYVAISAAGLHTMDFLKNNPKATEVQLLENLKRNCQEIFDGVLSTSPRLREIKVRTGR